MNKKISVVVLASSAILGADTFAAALEEVVVTATRRSVSLQDTGISVSAFSGAELEQLNITDTDMLTLVTPGLMFQNGGGAPLVGLVAIRGVSQNDFAGHIESPNALYVDEVYQPSISTNSIKMYDLERVEILRGPQGTLFGRNATGGLIQLITNKPTDEFEAYLDASAGNYNYYTAEGAVSGKLTDGVSGRLAFYHGESKGYINNSIGPDQVADDTDAARMHINFEPSDRLDILLSADYYRTDTDNVGGAHSQGALVDPVTGLGYNVPGINNTVTGYTQSSSDIYDGAYDQPGYIDRKSYNLVSNISYQFDKVRLVSLSNYNNVNSDYLEDNDLSPLPFIEFSQTGDSDAYSQEFRIEQVEGATRWTAGLYFLNIDGNYSQALAVNPPPDYDPAAVHINQTAKWSLDTTSWSAFGQLEQDLSPDMVLTAGLRWTYDEKDYHYNVIPQLFVGGNLIPGEAPLGAPPGTLVNEVLTNGPISNKHNEDGFSARLQLDYSVTTDWLLYASFNKGYKAFNYNAGFAGFAPYSGLRFDGEDLYAYETGSKLEFWDGKARWNISAYYYDYQNYQAFDQRGINFTLFNTDATMYGMDTELTVSPTDTTNLIFGMSLLHTEVEDVPIGVDPENPIYVDRDAPQSPDFTFNGTIIQDFPLEVGNISVQFSGYYNGGYYSQLTNAPNTKIPSFTVYNGRVSFSDHQDRYEVSVFAKNMFNEKYYTYAFDIAANGFTEQTLGPPRWVGVEGRYNF
ncbi:MAG: TonB-dependent receptor [Halieaceae bacterium]|nr:TonB-dependent receptor [Halieaceae bacterium]